MDDFEERLQRYRPLGPPPDLRGRVVASVSRERLAGRPSWLRAWLAPVAAAIVAVLFSWLAANERQLIASYVPPPADDASMNVAMELTR